jgi:hypothetical protein
MYEPEAAEQLSVEVPEVPRVMLEGESEQLRPVDG